MVGLLDTSAFIAIEQERLIGHLPDDLAVSVVALAELRMGVLMAVSDDVRILRLSTFEFARALIPVPIDIRVAQTWAELGAKLKSAGRKVPVNDTWIAATALTHGMAVVTQDRDYHLMPGVEVIRL